MNGLLSYDDLRFRMETSAGPGDWWLVFMGLVIRPSGPPMLGGVVCQATDPTAVKLLTFEWDGTPAGADALEGPVPSSAEPGVLRGLERRAAEAAFAMQLQRAAEGWPLPAGSPVRHDLQMLHGMLTGEGLQPLVHAAIPGFARWLEG